MALRILAKYAVEVTVDFCRGLFHSVKGFFQAIICDNKDDALLASAANISSKHVDVRKTIHPDCYHKSEDNAAKAQSSSLRTYGLIVAHNLSLTVVFVLASFLETILPQIVHPSCIGLSKLFSFLLNIFCFSSKLLYVKFTNVVFQNQIAEQVFREKGGRPRSVDYISVGSDFYASFQIQLIFYFLIMVICWYFKELGVITTFVQVACLSFYYSLYTFDFYWYYMSVPFKDRLGCIEKNWPYYFGFGFILGCIDTFLHPVWSSTVPMLFIPMFIVSAITTSSSLQQRNLFYKGYSLSIFKFPVMISNCGHYYFPIIWSYILRLLLCRPHSLWQLLMGTASSVTPSSESSSRASTPAVPETSNATLTRQFDSSELSSVGMLRPSPRDLGSSSYTSRQQKSIPVNFPRAGPSANELRVAHWVTDLSLKPTEARSSQLGHSSLSPSSSYVGICSVSSGGKQIISSVSQRPPSDTDGPFRGLAPVTAPAILRRSPQKFMATQTH